MYVKALELVQLWDASVEAYGTVMGLFEHNPSVMAPFNKCRDGLGLEDRAGSKKVTEAGT